ncbi:ABC transporter substrate-binding protein [Paenibacillus sp. 7523-1]|uniref:ABC transporter substrate-binding protein n=1 Tax=Paenibacillus sp. 7523-1 TaxID=2022550 RepID=UPI000BA77646|nr:ABC transporter substrate-binding protein [Paenibacillus sp. 7523-1]PAD33016.1 myristoyl transferase [Paenibacillus sp. 7523-1]
MSKHHMNFRYKKWLLSAASLILLLLSACSNSSALESAAQAGGEAGTDLKKVKLIEGWYAKGEDGGYFAALQQNFYKDKGIDMTIQPGGPEVSTMQLVAAGKAEFGISYADEILKAREQGIPVVGILAGFQSTPQVLMYHKGENIQDFADLNGKTVYIGTAVPYWEYIKSQYNLTDVKEMKYNGQLVNFINDPRSLNQGYITNEPYALSQQGVEVDYLKIADSGYANYADVLFTTEDYLKEHPDVVEAVVQASQKGWSYYLDNYEKVNPFIQTYNPDMTVEAMNYEAVQEKPFILNKESEANGIGYMTKERWSTLQDQMIKGGGLTKSLDVTQAFTTEYLMKP